ncbi:hypothetical protein [Paucihalobacter sp.]|uniref:hypothetical protein n=1 Tax=Paucihalobacter sp. TaxID=2850405 RepID=UPI002FE2D8F8
MNDKLVLKSLLVLLAIAFIVVQVMGMEFYGAGIKAVLLIGLTALYYMSVEQKSIYFKLFLLFFTAGAILDFVAWLELTTSLFNNKVYYYVINSLFIFAYLLLIIKVLRGLDLKILVRKLPFHIIILVVLDVFSVIVISETTEKVLNPTEYFLEFVYNSVVMALLSVALLNYIYRDDIKSMNLLIGSILIVFSEVIQLAYFYIESSNTLNIMCSVLLVGAFLFFYIHSTLKNSEPIMSPYSDDLKI